jgi:hypothetical protein
MMNEEEERHHRRRCFPLVFECAKKNARPGTRSFTLLHPPSMNYGKVRTGGDRTGTTTETTKRNDTYSGIDKKEYCRVSWRARDVPS